MTENMEQIEETVVVSELCDTDIVIKYCLENKISKTSIDELLKRGFTSLEALQLVEMGDLVGPKIPKGQRRLILHIATALKGTAASASTTGGEPTDGTARLTAETPIGNQSATEVPPAIPDNTPVGRATTSNGVCRSYVKTSMPTFITQQ